MDNVTGLNPSFRDLPHLFDAHHISLGVSILVQTKLLNQCLGEASP
jgi:hypothetical protein